MQADPPTRFCFRQAVLLLALFWTSSAWAQHHYYNVPSGADCAVREYRKQTLTANIYDALFMAYNVPATEGNSGAGWYGGAIHYADHTRNFYSFWPANIGYPPGNVQRFLYAGPVGHEAEWHVSIGEGTIGGVSSSWPVFQTNQWYRFAVRYWQPADGTQHVGYQGHWMRDAVTGVWYHQCTTEYPFGALGVDGLGGFQEDFAGSGSAHRADYRNAYYHKDGAWQAATSFHSDGFNGDLQVIDGGTAVSSQSWGSNLTMLPANLRGTNGMTVTTPNQPAAPTFDPIVVSSSGATYFSGSNQVIVQWQMAATSSPQLTYKIEVFNNSSYTGSAAVTFTENDPEARQKVLAIPGVITPYVRLRITDIFSNVGSAVLITPTAGTLNAAVSPATSSGLAYSYYEAGSGVNWTALPNSGALTPVLQGVVSSADVTPRKRRINYAFTYAGYLDVPASGGYAFTLRCGSGATLSIDGQSVVSFDGQHNSTDAGVGWVGLQAGKHAISLQYFQGAATDLLDGLGLFYEGPNLAEVEIPASAFSRATGSGEPTVAIASPGSNASIDNANPNFSATVSANGATINNVQYYLTDFYSYFYRPNQGVDYYLGQSSVAPYALNSMVWNAPLNQVRARVIYNTNKTIDSAPVTFASPTASLTPWNWYPLEVHNYPSGAGIQGNTLNLLGDGMNLLCRQVTGNCVLIARLAGQTANAAGPDGKSPDAAWRAGIILRGTTSATMGEPLGDGGTTRFAALFSSVGGGTYFEDDTMRNGNNDANRWSSNLGGGNRWYKLQRTGDQFVSSVSTDGADWTVVNTVTLANFGSTINAGVFVHAVQSENPNIHSAAFDHFNLLGTSVVGPTSVSIDPPTSAVVSSLPVTLAVSVIGPAPTSYQWRFNGDNIANATGATYTIPSMSAADVGSYTVVVNGTTTSAPAVLSLSTPAGSSTWTNGSGGSWITTGNWAGNQIATGTSAVGDFGTLNLSANPTVSLNGARTIGHLLFDDANATTKHSWTLATGSAGPLTLATSSGTPVIAAKTPATISAVLAGTQGFIKTGGDALTLSGASTVTGTIQVATGTLEVQSKSGDTPYTVAQGGTLKIGYSPGGGYASTGLTITGNGTAATTGLYLKGGTNYNCSGQVSLITAPTTIRQYGTGLAGLGTFDINGDGLWCTSKASGSATDANVQFVSRGYGMSVLIDAGVNTATGDFVLNGPLNVLNLGLHKRGAGSLTLNAAANSANVAVRVLAGSVLCGAAQCLGANAALVLSAGGKIYLNGFNQASSSLAAPSGSTVDFGTGTLTVPSATLGGALQMEVHRSYSSPANGKLVVTTGAMTFAGTLTVTNPSGAVLRGGDAFQLFDASSYTGSFSSMTLPALPTGASWDTSKLSTNGRISVVDAYIVWAAALTAGVNDGRMQDADGDRLNNLGEFGFDTDAKSAKTTGKIVTRLATISGQKCLVITLPLRTGTVLSGGSGLVSATIDGLIYHIEGTANLTDWNLPLTEVLGADATTLKSGLPALDTGWSYRSFRTAGGLTKAFLHAWISEP